MMCKLRKVAAKIPHHWVIIINLPASTQYTTYFTLFQNLMHNKAHFRYENGL